MNEDRHNARYNKIRKTAIFLAYLLVFLILALLIFMFWDAFKSNSAAPQETIIENSTIAPENETLNTPIAESEEPIATPTATPFIIPEIPIGQAGDYGFDQAKLDELDKYMQSQIDDGFPGAVLLIAKEGNIIFHKAYGYSKKYEGSQLMDEFESMSEDTLFDLASLSKIYATTFSIMKLVDDEMISLDGKVADYLSDYGGGEKNKITVRMLLSHNAGYIKDYYFYKDGNYATRNREQVYNNIKQIPLDESPGKEYDYNNIDYMILGMIVEEVSGMRIDEYAREKIYEPLGLDNQITYIPLQNGIEKQNVAATERQGNTRDGAVYFDGIRQYTLQGEVHDENAYYCMDQVAGHAGLFANGYGLTVLNQLLLNKGEYGGVRIYKVETVENWLVTFQTEARYQLGFWNAKMASATLKNIVSNQTFYHNGWTGTATLLDVENNMSIILLSNKRHCPCPDGEFEALKYDIAKYVPVFEKIYNCIED